MRLLSATRLLVDPATRPGYVLVTHDWTIWLEDGRWVRVPAGFCCDGASIPALARPWLHPLTLLALGVGHDYAVRPGAVLYREARPPEPFDLAGATDLAMALAERAGVGRFRRWVIRAGLRLAARTYWHGRPMDWQP